MHGRLIEFDWTEIILDLRRAGMRQHEIAKAAGKAAGEAAIRSYLAGATPVHWRGEILLDLWCERTGKPRDAAPTRPARPYVAAPRRKQRRGGDVLMPSEHLPAVAQAYGLSVLELIKLLSGRRKMAASRRYVQMELPGFEG